MYWQWDQMTVDHTLKLILSNSLQKAIKLRVSLDLDLDCSEDHFWELWKRILHLYIKKKKIKQSYTMNPILHRQRNSKP